MPIPTPAEQYRTLVARLEALQEAPIASAPQPPTAGPTPQPVPVSVPTVGPATGPAVTPQTPLQRMASLPKDEQDKIMAVLYKNTRQLGPQAQRMLPVNTPVTTPGPVPAPPESPDSMYNYPSPVPPQ